MIHRKRKFKAIIEDAGNGGAFVTVPFDVEKVFGKKRVKVWATIAGEPYRGSIVRMGGECHVLGVLKEIREKTGKSVGDEIEVEVEEDIEPREIVIPPDLKTALESDPEINAFFNSLAFSHRREYVKWVEDAKRDETRQGRISRTIELLVQGKKNRG